MGRHNLLLLVEEGTVNTSENLGKALAYITIDYAPDHSNFYGSMVNGNENSLLNSAIEHVQINFNVIELQKEYEPVLNILFPTKLKLKI